MVEIGPRSTPIVWAGDGALQLTKVVADDRTQPGSALVESGMLADGEVLD
jgi:hypothetical protein